MSISQPLDDDTWEDLDALGERVRGAIKVYKSHPPETRAAKVREYLSENPREGNAGQPAREVVQVWKPSGVQDAWFVPWSGPLVMSKQQYCLQFESRLRDLIVEKPREAEDILTGSPEWNPDFYQIALYNDPEAWAV